jgi:ATP-dependent RNA helicase DDX51/DBP6
LAARGLDLENAQAVINYDIPNTAKAYVHRAGRCARAGKEGTAWTLAEIKEMKPFKEKMKRAGRWETLHQIRLKNSRPLIQDDEAYNVSFYSNALGGFRVFT